jgi:glycosyltransferase involved in cell wall biosynthesis
VIARLDSIRGPVQTEPASKPAVAVAIPAYNEADGIAEFLREIDATLAPQTSDLRLVVVDDASTDGTAQVLEQLRPELSATLEVFVNPSNRGHGPSVLTAYARALEHEPDYVLQVDGDGQFAGSDLRRVLVLLVDQAHAVCGVRRFRQDPWFRMAMTRLLRLYISSSFHVSARDANCPLRGYDASLLRELLGLVPDSSLIPNLYLSVIAARRGFTLLEVDVSHRVRRGDSATGSTWGRTRGSLIPWRLVRFSAQALQESRAFRARLDRGSQQQRAVAHTPAD